MIVSACISVYMCEYLCFHVCVSLCISVCVYLVFACVFGTFPGAFLVRGLETAGSSSELLREWQSRGLESRTPHFPLEYSHSSEEHLGT